MDELMLASTIRLTALPALFQTWQASAPTDPDAPTLMLLESLPRHTIEQRDRQNLLRFAIFQSDIDVATYRSGRVFHEYGELRWESLNADDVQVVYTGTPRYQLTLPESQFCEFNDRSSIKASRTYFLFGKRLEQNELDRIGPIAKPGDFAEVRVPRLLRYPNLRTLAKAERLQLAAYTYLDRATGAHIAYRFHGLEPFPRKEQSGREEKTPA